MAEPLNGTHYAWEKFLSSKRGIGQIIMEMRKTRDKIEKLLPISKERAKEVYDDLIRQHGKLLEDISSCRLCLSEMDLMQEAALAAGLYRAVKGFTHFYSLLDKLDARNLDIRTKVRFVSYLHEERFINCLDLAGKNRTPGVEALLYILTGCNELWNVGVETFYDYDVGATISYADSKNSLSDNGRELLRLAYHLANSFDRDDLVHILRHYFPGLEYIHLELAIEAIKLALFPGIVG